MSSRQPPPQDPTQPQQPVDLRTPHTPPDPGRPHGDPGSPADPGRLQGDPGSSADPGRLQGDPGSPAEPARSRRADRPTAPAAARASLSAAARALRLVFTEPSRRRSQRRARIDLGRAVAVSLAGQPAPPLLATPLAAHRAAQLRLASTDPPPRPGSGTPAGEPAPRPADGVWSARHSGAGAATEPQAPRAGSRAGARRAGLRERDLAGELERLLLLVVQFLPRLAARMRLRAADERLGAWASGLSD